MGDFLIGVLASRSITKSCRARPDPSIHCRDSVTGGQTESHWTASGFEFLHAEAGSDYRVARNLSIGPFFSVSVAHYSSQTNWYPAAGQRSLYSATFDIPNSAIHEWIMFGLRVSHLIVVK
jgi:hypothetical protein